MYSEDPGSDRPVPLSIEPCEQKILCCDEDIVKVSSSDGTGRSFEFCPTDFDTEADGCKNGLLIQATDDGIITGSSCNDVIIGPDANLISELVGTGGDDVLVLKNGSAIGGNGADWIYVLNAGASVRGGPGEDHIFGSPGDDVYTLFGNNDVDYVYGLGGNDWITGQGGDFIFGGAGNDILVSNENGGNTLSGGSGSNYFYIYETTNPDNKRTTIQDF